MKYKKQSVAFVLGMILLLVGTGSLMVAAMGQIKEKMNISANTTLLNSTRMISDSLLNNFSSDQQQLETCANLFSRIDTGQAPDVVRALAEYTDATAFFRFYFIGADGQGWDSTGAGLSPRDLSFDEIALSQGKTGYSDAYIGASGRLQITFQTPVWIDGEQAGALYADKTMANYHSPSLFTFSGGAGSAYVVQADDGAWIIDSSASGTDDLYTFLEKQHNDPAVSAALKNLIAEKRSGTIRIHYRQQDSFLCFIPLDCSHPWYLISILPQNILQQESAEILQLISFALAGLLVALVLITVLLLSRQASSSREQERKRREQLFQIISENVDFAFLLYTPSKRKVEMLSENVRILFNIEPDDAVQHPERLFLSCGMPEQDPAGHAFLNGQLNQRQRCEYQQGTANELQRWIEIYFIPVHADQYLAVLHETTPEHHMRQDLADALRQSQENNQARTVFFSSMSHDIRTPMNGIIGMTTIAQAHLDEPEKVAHCLDKISLASQHLLDLINEVLDMSRIESGKISLKKESVNLSQLISDVLILVKPDLTKKRQTLHIRSSALDYDTVIGDILHLQKILLNLLSNAVKYTPPDQDITIGLHEEPDGDDKIKVIFTVEDTGIGMTPEFLTRIFTPFERAQDSRISQISGTGLGMAITKNIVDMMSGTIQVESQLGVGSKFTVTLPLSTAQTPQLQEAALAGCRILVVDDDQDTCEGLRAMLEVEKVQVTCANTGQQGIDAALLAHQEGKDYLGIIMDWRMDDLNGIEAARRIRAQISDEIPIILLSAYNWEDVEQEALDAGIDGFLTKPIFRNELIEKLSRALTRNHPDSETAEETQNNRGPAEDFSGMRVLLAEDNELNREIVIELLNSCGIKLTCAQNGRQALDLVQEQPADAFDLILMDIHMPEMNGYEATEAIRNLADPAKAALPIIAMTADAFEEDVQKCIAAGMNGHIAKPIEYSLLFETLRRYQPDEQPSTNPRNEDKDHEYQS